MASISIQRRHQLGLDHAREVVAELARSLEKDLNARWRWHGNELRFERTGASGSVHVADDRVRVEVQLGLLLRPLRERISEQITQRLDRLLGPLD